MKYIDGGKYFQAIFKKGSSVMTKKARKSNDKSDFKEELMPTSLACFIAHKQQ
jgi:hypothetical protein